MPATRFLAALVVLGMVCTSDADAAGAAIPLRYDAELTAVGFPSPLVSLTVGGQTATFLIDTGAGVHAFARWFVEASGLRPEPTNGTTTGSTGIENQVDLVSMVASTLDSGRLLVLPQATVADFPPLFAQHRIGGLLSPQLLAASGEDAILDLRTPRLTFREAHNQFGAAAGKPAVASPAVCVSSGSPFRNRLYSTAVRLDGVPATLLVDSGATRTMLASTSQAAEAFAQRSVASGQSQGVGGQAEKVRRIPSVSVVRGGATAIVDLGLGTVGRLCGTDGLLGMDALRHCVATMSDSRFALTCGR
jgi:hypothetical protein